MSEAKRWSKRLGILPKTNVFLKDVKSPELLFSLFSLQVLAEMAGYPKAVHRF